ncbi:unnamed protein product [Fusarium fujikuroi]|uniref:Uncharacterized protein n=1 Tax=Fusarium fujikuroi TaxID=5127 RepID=A0A9Q9RMN2_FUSFU|nr:unnamed protein product [Fusarium fujikuroi]
MPTTLIIALLFYLTRLLILTDVLRPISIPNSSFYAKIVLTKPTKALALLEKKIIPLELELVFYKNRGGNYKDISPDAIKLLADAYYKANLSVNIKPDSPAARIIKSNLYYYKVKGYKTTVKLQDLYIPLRNNSLLYKDLFIKAYTGCDNGSIRGYIDAGCI